MTKNAYVLCAAINCLPLFELTTISTVLPSTSEYVLEHIKNSIFLIAFGYYTDYEHTQFVCLSQKVCDFNKRKASLGIHSLWGIVLYIKVA